MGNVAAALVQKNIVIDYFCAGVQKNMSIKTIRKGKRTKYRSKSAYWVNCTNDGSKRTGRDKGNQRDGRVIDCIRR